MARAAARPGQDRAAGNWQRRRSLGEQSPSGGRRYYRAGVVPHCRHQSGAVRDTVASRAGTPVRAGVVCRTSTNAGR